MARIRCHYTDCIYLEEGYCSSSSVEFDPEMGCMTFSRISALDIDDELDEIEEWDEIDNDDDLWLDEEDDY